MGTFACRNDWICASLIVPRLKNAASLMMLPGWNFDRSAVLTGSATRDAEPMRMPPQRRDGCDGAAPHSRAEHADDERADQAHSRCDRADARCASPRPSPPSCEQCDGSYR